MTLETFDRVLHWIKLLNPTGQPETEAYLHLHGIGEPLLNPDIVKMTALANKIKPTGFSTNGVLLGEMMVRALKQANIAYLCISEHDKDIAQRASDLCKKYNIDHYIQKHFNDDWAGQVDWEQTSVGFQCAHIETGGAHILWDGRIVTCCVDTQASPVLGNVYDNEIRHIEIQPIPLCKNCRSNFYWKYRKLQEYSDTLKYNEKEKMFEQWLIEMRGKT